jgi:hypothetical protein
MLAEDEMARDLADSVTKSVEDSMGLPPSTPDVSVTQEDPQKITRYMERGMEEVKNLLNDLNYELDDVLSPGSVSITTIDFDNSGASIVEINRSFDLKDSEKQMDIRTKSSQFTALRPDFAKYITFTVRPPGNMSPEVIVQIKLRLPKALVEDIVGGPANQNWSKAGKAIESFVAKLIKLL